MLHPNATLFNSKIEGKGLKALHLIPRGTILWKSSSKDRKRSYTREDYLKLSKNYQKVIDRYSYPDEFGNLVLSLDNDRHWNHSCNANVLDVPNQDMCIVVRDIHQGEEITYDYGLNLRKDLRIQCRCGESNCRKIIKRANKSSILYKKLLIKEQSAVRFIKKVRQPLLTRSWS
jgi:SET domain-containing protein